MKKTPLKRKTPMKRTGFKKKEYDEFIRTASAISPIIEMSLKNKRDKIKALERKLSQLSKPRKRIRPVSKKRADWHKKYIAKRKADPVTQKCSKCTCPGTTQWLQPHHPYGRLNERILEYVYLCPYCHEMVHAYAQQARSMGWLQPEFDGRPPDPKVPKPWIH